MHAPLARLARLRVLVVALALGAGLVAAIDQTFTAAVVPPSTATGSGGPATAPPATPPATAPGGTRPASSAVPSSSSSQGFGNAGPAVIAMVVVALVALVGGWWAVGRGTRTGGGRLV